MYKLKDGVIYRRSDSVEPNVLVTQLNNIEQMLAKHNLPKLGSNLRVMADWLDMQDTSDGLLDDNMQQDLHTIANFISALQREILI